MNLTEVLDNVKACCDEDIYKIVRESFAKIGELEVEINDRIEECKELRKRQETMDSLELELKGLKKLQDSLEEETRKLAADRNSFEAERKISNMKLKCAEEKVDNMMKFAEILGK